MIKMNQINYQMYINKRQKYNIVIKTIKNILYKYNRYNNKYNIYNT